MFALGIGMQPLNVGKSGPRSSSRYMPVAPAINTPFSMLLEKYSRVPVKQQRGHVQRVREEIYDDHPYPCLGLFKFIEFQLPKHPLYNSAVLPILTKDVKEGAAKAKEDDGPIFLDLGTCLGQDLRFLAFHPKPPVPASRLYGADLTPEFVEAGYRLFQDEDWLPRSHMLAPADVFDTSSGNQLAKLEGKCAIVQINNVFHLFDMERQLACAQRCVRLLDLKPDAGIGTTAGTDTSNGGAKSKGGMFRKLSRVATGGSDTKELSGRKRGLIMGSQIGAFPPGLHRSSAAPAEGSAPANATAGDGKSATAMTTTVTETTSQPSRNVQPVYRHSDQTWVDFWQSKLPAYLREHNVQFEQRDGTVCP